MNKNQAYTALSDLIFRGFLTTEIDLDGELFVFKTINEREFNLMKLLSGNPERPDHILRFNAYYLVFSLFVARGKNYLANRSDCTEELYSFFSRLPAKLVSRILTGLNKMRLDAYDSMKYIEGFCYTRVSRTYWKSLIGMSPCLATGIPGVSEIGMNVHQESWSLINKSLDSEEDHSSRFYLALMVASASNPKGTRSIRNQHETQLQDIESRRIKLAEVGFIDVERQWKPDGWAAPVDTAEELVAELERQIRGVKDRHDIYMDKYVEGLRKEAEQKTREAQERIRKAQEAGDNVFIDGSTRVLTPEENAQLMRQKPATTAMVMSETAVSLEDQDKFLNKIGSRVLTGDK